MDFLINNIGWFFCIAIVSVLALIGYKADSKEKQSNANPKYIPKKEDVNEKYNEEQTPKKDEFYYNPTNENNEETKIENDMKNIVQEENRTIENNDNKINDEMADLYEPLKPMQGSQENEQQEEQIDQSSNNEEKTIVENQTKEIDQPIDQQTNVINNVQPEEPQQIVPDINNLENLNISLEELENKNYNALLNKINGIKEEQPANENNIQPEEQIEHQEESQQEINQNIEAQQQENTESEQVF